MKNKNNWAQAAIAVVLLAAVVLPVLLVPALLGAATGALAAWVTHGHILYWMLGGMAAATLVGGAVLFSNNHSV